MVVGVSYRLLSILFFWVSIGILLAQRAQGYPAAQNYRSAMMSPTFSSTKLLGTPGGLDARGFADVGQSFQ